jgi:glycosyltransferase involved in cell wall biosynthesis
VARAPAARLVTLNTFILKRPSHNSKGVACVRCSSPVYPWARVHTLKAEWYLFWFSCWTDRLEHLPYGDLIDCFVGWDDLKQQLEESGRSDYVFVRGGGETYDRHDQHFFAMSIERDIDLVYIAKFHTFKRYDVALQACRYIATRKPDLRAIFLESYDSPIGAREQVQGWIHEHGLSRNIEIATVPLEAVNRVLNRAKVSLFCSDVEGMCRAVLQSLLAERPLLCYRHTHAHIRMLYDDRFMRFYDHQTGESAGEAALTIIHAASHRNSGARDYLLREWGFRFYDMAGWQEQVLDALTPLYHRDGQRMNREDVVPASEITPAVFWKELEFV